MNILKVIIIILHILNIRYKTHNYDRIIQQLSYTAST